MIEGTRFNRRAVIKIWDDDDGSVIHDQEYEIATERVEVAGSELWAVITEPSTPFDSETEVEAVWRWLEWVLRD